MTEFTMKIAGRVVAVKALFESTQKYCSGYLSREMPEFTVEITPADIDFEKQKFVRKETLQCNAAARRTDASLEVTAVQRKITEAFFERDILVFHGSAVAVDGRCYLFTARSGTGKSTHTRLWRELLGDRAVMVNDDKPFLQIREDGVFVCGSPWNGKHGLGTNICVPLQAICLLERGEENSICAIPASKALSMLIQQSQRPAQGKTVPKYMELIDKLARNVTFYRLACNMDPDAARVSYETMSGDGKE